MWGGGAAKPIFIVNYKNFFIFLLKKIIYFHAPMHILAKEHRARRLFIKINNKIFLNF
jgi:hypothetical protein